MEELGVFSAWNEGPGWGNEFEELGYTMKWFAGCKTHMNANPRFYHEQTNISDRSRPTNIGNSEQRANNPVEEKARPQGDTFNHDDARLEAASTLEKRQWIFY